MKYNTKMLEVMDIHEELVLKKGERHEERVKRVPNGWLYYSFNKHDWTYGTYTFVPEK